MRRSMKIAMLIMLAASLVFTVGCARKISEMTGNIDAYEGKEVSVKGKVTNVLSISLIGVNLYEIYDGTGTMWVNSAGGVPAKNETVKVKGVVESGVRIGGKNYGVILQASKK